MRNMSRRRALLAAVAGCAAAARGMAMDEQTVIEVERLGGFVGYGPGSRFQARGTLPWGRVPAAERDRLERLLDGRLQVPPVPRRGADAFRYRITVRVPGGVQSIELPEDETPQVLRECVREVPR